MKSRRPGDPLTISYIASATIVPVITVRESDTLARARTLMELNDFSQLPVVRGSGKHPKGVVTWETIGKALISNPHADLADCIDANPPIFPLDHDLLPAIETINKHGYALVIKTTKELSGIVTSADLGSTLAAVAEPFLLLERLEDHLRRIIERLKAGEHIEDVSARRSTSKKAIEKGAETEDLTLGEKIDLVTDRSGWQHVTTEYDRAAIATDLGKASELRNQLMHFRELNDTQKDSLSGLHHLVDVIGHIAESTPSPHE